MIPVMCLFRLFAIPALAIILLTPAFGQTPGPGAGATDGLDNNKPVAPPAAAAHDMPAPAPASTAVAAKAATPSLATPALDPKSAVQSILAMFMPNSGVNLPETGKPLPLTGSWGVQTQFPEGLPKACQQARLPCMKVVYRVPEAKIICDWTLAVVTAVEPQHDGTIQHVTREVLLDENEAAALYTLRKAWLHGESAPEPVVSANPEYPSSARSAHIGGVVSVRLLIGPDGVVKNATANSGPPMLQQAALDAVRKWKFDPLAIGHQATSFQVDEQFNYDPGKTNTMAGMGTGGVTYTLQSDPRLGTSGMVTQGVSSGSWASCNAATGCVFGAPTVPK